MLRPLQPGRNACVRLHVRRPVPAIPVHLKEDAMRRTSVVLLSLMMLLSLTVLTGCPKKAEVSSAPETPPQKVEPAPAPAEDAAKKAAEQKAADEAAAAAAAKRAEEERAKEKAAKTVVGLQPVYFDFDKSFIRDDAKPVMKANAEYLKANPKVKIRIEGNCDERGTIEYNQALGQRRAQAAKKYLTDLGIAAARISLISYGKEKPICTQSSEDCWQKNRRDDLISAE
jgi:peptidoglycan-associated lipoprotein